MTTTENALRVDGVAAILDALAAKVPAPGGGATAALHLGQAAALVSMVARYTVGARYAENEALATAVCADADAVRGSALQLIDDDMAAFSGVISAYKMPKATAAESELRSAAISAASVQAAEVPARVADGAATVVALAEKLVPVANPNVISDVAAAADATRASFVARMEGVDALAARADAITDLVRKQLTAWLESLVAVNCRPRSASAPSANRVCSQSWRS